MYKLPDNNPLETRERIQNRARGTKTLKQYTLSNGYHYKTLTPVMTVSRR